MATAAGTKSNFRVLFLPGHYPLSVRRILSVSDDYPRPFGELDLCNQLWFEPHTVFHLFLGQSPLGALFLRQISKRANVDLHGLDKANLGRRVGIEVL